MNKQSGLSQNIAWNFAGNVLPLVTAVITIPFLLHRMGPDKYGLLTFVWMIVGYSALLDLGVGRALTQGIAERLSRGEHEKLLGLVLTGSGLLACFAVVGGLTLLAMSGLIVERGIKVPISMISDALQSVRMLAIAFPLVVIGAGLRGILEGYQRFRTINLVKTTAGVLFYLSPLLVIQLTHEVWAVVGALILVRALEVGCYIVLCIRMLSPINYINNRGSGYARHLFSFGLWSTANNLVGSLMTLAYVDRIFLTALLGTGVLTFFATPFDMVARTLIVPAAIVGVLFPAFSSLGTEKPGEVGRMADQATLLVAYVTLPVYLSLIVLARPLLTLWLGSTFSAQSALSLQLFSIGTLAVAIGYVPFALIQAMGRPDLTAKRHFLEIPFYLFASFLAIRKFGLVGASVVWCAWAWIDLTLTLRLRRYVLVRGKSGSQVGAWFRVSALIGVAWSVGCAPWLWVQLAAGILLPVGFIAWGWKGWLDHGSRAIVVRHLPGSLRSYFEPTRVPL